MSSDDSSSSHASCPPVANTATSLNSKLVLFLYSVGLVGMVFLLASFIGFSAHDMSRTLIILMIGLTCTSSVAFGLSILSRQNKTMVELSNDTSTVAVAEAMSAAAQAEREAKMKADQLPPSYAEILIHEEPPPPYVVAIQIKPTKSLDVEASIDKATVT